MLWVYFWYNLGRLSIRYWSGPQGQWFCAFLVRLFDRVDLIKPVSNVRPSVRTDVHAYIRMSVCPQKVSSISMKFGM